MSDATLKPFVRLDGTSLTIGDVERVVRERHHVDMSDGAWERIAEARAVVYEAIERGVPLYGVTTGVGSQKDYSFDNESVQEFNERLIRAHATYIPGYDLSKAEVRAALLILLNGYAEGTSGIRAETVQKLLTGLNSDFVPEVRDNCSVGAGDLVPLAQIAAGFITDSEIEFKFAAKEALSLMCSNAISLAKAALAVIEGQRFLTAIDLVAATSLEDSAVIHNRSSPPKCTATATKWARRINPSTASSTGWMAAHYGKRGNRATCKTR